MITLSPEELTRVASQVRRDIIRMTHGAASGHPGGSLGVTDVLVALYFSIMLPDPEHFTMDGVDEDLLFVSNGHTSPAWYSVLARYGYFDIDELRTFRKLDSRLQGHPSPLDEIPGIRMASGSLGQGLSVALGAALVKKLNQDAHAVFCLMGDGELQEGQNWEAFLYGAARKVDNLIALIDYNGKQIDGSLDEVVSLGDLRGKLTAFGWGVLEVEGNNMEAVIDGLTAAKAQLHQDKPVVIILHTHMGYGVDFMVDNHNWHGVAPGDEEATRALAQLDETRDY